MGAGALFHQTSLFRICREANFSKCYRYEIEVRLDTDGSGIGYYYYYYYYYSYYNPSLRRRFTNSRDE